jgi:hypothetical protein
MNNNTETSQAIMFMQNMMTNMMVQLQKNNERAEKNEQLVNELMRMQRESVQVKSENAFSSVPSTTVHPSSIPASSHQHSSTPASSSIHSSSRVSMKNSSSPAPASPSSSPSSSPVRNRSRSKAEKVVSSSIKRSKEEVKIMKNERRKERDEEEIYESVSDDDPYASYLAFLIKRQQLYPFERNEYVYDNSFTLYSESGRLCEYIRFMIMCAADEKLYPPSTRRWYDFKVSEFTGSIKKQHQRDVKDTAVIFPQLSLDDRDVRYNVKSSEDADIPINSYALLGTPDETCLRSLISFILHTIFMVLKYFFVFVVDDVDVGWGELSRDDAPLCSLSLITVTSLSLLPLLSTLEPLRSLLKLRRLFIYFCNIAFTSYTRFSPILAQYAPYTF